MTPTHCVPTVKDPMSVAVLEDIEGMAEHAKVNFNCHRT